MRNLVVWIENMDFYLTTSASTHRVLSKENCFNYTRKQTWINIFAYSGLDDLKDYAIALTEATGLSQAQRDEVAQKLARDLLNEMRVMDGRKRDLMKELMSFVTATEVSTFKGIFFIFIYENKTI